MTISTTTIKNSYSANSSTVTYATPLIRVIQTSDVQEYDLGTNNLYQFSLNLEEAQ